MTGEVERWRQLQQLLDDALALPRDEVPSYLDRACAGDDALRREVERLVDSCERAAHFLEEPPSALAASLLAHAPTEEEYQERLQAALPEQYTLRREVGHGGMATVYLADDRRHGREVVVKALFPELGSPSGGERFLRETRITAGLTHPHILPLLDSGAAAGVLYYVMPYVAGESLRGRLDREGQLPLRDALRIAREVADALGYAHEHGVIHRDIKPENVLLSSGHAVVADFGIARAVDAAQDARLTGAGLSPGTPAYMSPEQGAADARIDGRADLYALGCVLYEMLAGTPPFTGLTPAAVLARHAADPVPPIRTVRPHVPEQLERVIERALAKTPADRFASAAELIAALDAIPEAGSEPHDQPARVGAGPARAPGPNDDRGRASGPAARRRVAAASTLALVAAALALVGALRDRETPSALPARSSAELPQPKAVSALEPTRIAVLPMVNLSPDPQDRYFAEGMTEEIISTLSSIDGLRVIARSSVVGYAGTTKPVSAIGRELRVGTVLESTVRKAGDRLRIAVRLVDVATEEPRWARQYDEELRDVFDIQRDVALHVADALKVRLLASEARQVARRPTENLDAYEQYLRATLVFEGIRRGLNRRPASDSAVALLRRAIALDSSFALARAMLGMVYAFRTFTLEPDPTLRTRAEAEIEHALALDSTLAEAHLARSLLLWNRESGWRYEEAFLSARRALALKPNLATAHNQIAALLFHYGLLREARAELEATLALDPSSPDAPPRIPRVLWYQQRFDSALAFYERGIGFPFEHALVLGYLGRSAEGLALLRQKDSQGNASDFAASRAVLLARLGRPTEAEAQIRLAIERGERFSHFHHAEYSIATAYAIMGNADQALHWLQRTADDGMPAYELFAGDPSLASLRSDPRFVQFMRSQRTQWERFRALLSG